MRLMRKDMREFGLYKPVPGRDTDGDKVNTFPDVSAVFYGSLQPYEQSRDSKDYGIDLRYAYAVYTQSDADFKEIDRIGTDKPQYKIKVIQAWNGYKRLLVEEVR